jgi:TonB family protein
MLLAVLSIVASGQNKLTAKAELQPQPATVDGPGSESDRMRDGLAGPVRRVRTEVIKVSAVAGKTVEDGKRVVLETAEYDIKGAKIQNQYFPIAGGNLTGREVYKYDDKGNISETVLINPDGSLISKEIYKYEFDSVGNWVKMTTSLGVVENGKISFEPSEVTYRTIFYYLDAAMMKMLESGSVSAPANAPAVSGQPTKPVELKTASSLPPQTSLSKLKVSGVTPPAGDLRSTASPSSRILVVENNEPPPAPRPLLKPVSGGVLNGKAVSLPAPTYPELARRMRTGGLVEIEVVVDETGKVISAHALSGPPSLREVSEQAALRAHFSPTKLSGQPVKITGRINYNFTIPQ